MDSFTFEIDNQPDLKTPMRGDYSAWDVEVEYSISEYVPERMWLPNGDPGYPAEGGELEDMRVLDMDGKDITAEVLPRWMDILQAECYKHYKRESSWD